MQLLTVYTEIQFLYEDGTDQLTVPSGVTHFKFIRCEYSDAASLLLYRKPYAKVKVS